MPPFAVSYHARFAYSSAFFSYDLFSRVPPLIAALVAAAGIPASALPQWRSRRTVWVACARHAAGVALSLPPPTLVAAVLARAPGRRHLEADDAMGVGIDFLVPVAVGLVSVGMLAAALALREKRR